VNGNVTLGKLDYRGALCVLQANISYYIIFPAILYTVFHILPFKQTEEDVLETSSHPLRLLT